MMSAIAFALAKFKVGDLAVLEHFYTAALGFTVTARIEEGEGDHQIRELILGLGGEQPHFALIHYPNQPVPLPGEAIVALVVADLESALAKVVAHGGTDQTGVIPVPDWNLKLAFVTDPEGHQLELMQKLPAETGARW